MSVAVTPEMIDAMIDAGLTREQMAELIKAALVREESSIAVKRSRKRRRLDISDREWFGLRWAVFERDGFCCTYCGADVHADPHCDHVVPLSRGGMSTLDNLTTACGRCNSSKRDRMIGEWRQR